MTKNKSFRHQIKIYNTKRPVYSKVCVEALILLCGVEGVIAIMIRHLVEKDPIWTVAYTTRKKNFRDHED